MQPLTVLVQIEGALPAAADSVVQAPGTPSLPVASRQALNVESDKT